MPKKETGSKTSRIIKPKRIKVPFFCNQSPNLYAFGGKRAKRTFDPSKGGIGIKLKTAKIKFISTRAENNVTIPLSGEIVPKEANTLSTMPKISTMIRLEAGPARPIHTAPLLGCFRYVGLNCTGFPQPKPAKSKKSVPIKSRCRKGLRDRRP